MQILWSIGDSKIALVAIIVALVAKNSHRSL